MYDMYPDRWTGSEAPDRQLQHGLPADRPQRRVRRTHEDRPPIIRIREERRSSDLSA